MPLIMRDSVDPYAIPVTGTDIAVYYGNGTYEDKVALFRLFPNIPKLGVDVNGSAPELTFRDWETGDKSGDLRKWVVDHNTITGQKDAVIYCNRSTIPEVRRLTGDQVLNRDYFLWVATLDGTLFTPKMLPGVVACQNLGVNQNGGNFDQSVVWSTPWVKRPVTPPPPPTSVSFKIVVDGPHSSMNYQVTQPTPSVVPAVVTWYGDSGVTSRHILFDRADWQRIVG